MANDDYLGAGPERQAGPGEPVSRFRPRYRPLTPAERDLHDDIKTKAAELEALFERARDLYFGPAVLIGEEEVAEDGSPPRFLLSSFDPAAEYFGDGMKALELSVMWTIKGLTSSKPAPEEWAVP